MVVVCLPQTLAQILHLRTGWSHPLQLALVVFILPPTGADTVLALEQLALCGGGGGGGFFGGVLMILFIQILHLCMWWFHPLQLAPVVFCLPPTGADTLLKLEQRALCGGGNGLVAKCIGVSRRKYQLATKYPGH